MIKPMKLMKGDTVGVVAPAGTPKRQALEKGVQFLVESGLQVQLGEHVHKEWGYLAGSDEERAEDLHRMFRDREIKAIFCARGGYGSARMATLLDYSLISKNPKIFWGYSDITFLHLAIAKNTGLVTFHGPMIASDFGRESIDPDTRESFQQVFSDQQQSFPYGGHPPLQTVVDGLAFGRLTGGNLTLMTSTLGTPYEIETTGKILFMEEINEEPRSVDRMLNQLLLAGKLQNAAGIVLGDFHDCTTEDKPSFELAEVLEHYLKVANRPAVHGLKAGHCSPNFGIPLGVNAILDTNRGQLQIDNGVR
ncbi:peptidase S66 [Mesobacillus campisalis]|uniref:Peptidase S66 n=1 Tax=Mesobacillus campisalis TaxID=1408103 RepID=A0A0M2SS07_9BACI|nr:LD-carboxypeptidase [Mesobacillus campisalis]KKK37349.1 peptidase S66 [Mesobacillus campisalis]